ncbi:MAG: isochorismatase family protein [Candidatus Latescibacteria bacterium]|nr:isochorismatase family protein [Candidatus Latescibacterota bacterium]
MEHTKAAIDSVRAYYQGQGIFLKKFGFGRKPALLIIDMAYGWTDPAYATGSSRLDETVAAIQRLLPACRAKGVPVICTTSPFRPDAEEPMHAQPGTKGFRRWDERACQLDQRLAPLPGDLVLYKDNASAFFGTHLAPYLIERGVDTLLITGCSTSACVRASATDARAYRFKAIIPRQAVQDRAEGAHEWNLFDIDAKFGDVVEMQEVLDYLSALEST